MERGNQNSISIAFFVIFVFSSMASCNSTKNVRDIWKGFSVSCTHEDPQNVSVSCHGVRIVRRIVQQLLEKSANQKSVQLFDGVTLVDTKGGGSLRSARLLKGSDGLESLIQLLEGRELRIKLPKIFPGDVGSALGRSLSTSTNEARGKGEKKGDSNVMVMGLMMGKMVMAMGFSALGVVAMKALLVSSLALMLSLITAIKKFSSKDDKEEHHVVYAQEVAHHRRRRNAPFDNDHELSPYRGYLDINANTKSS